MDKPENPAVFPPAITCTASGDVYHGLNGMALRDWFAGQALAGGLTADCGSPEEGAQHVYRIADAMLTERNRHVPQ
jgi:hypothetical protein